jgi:hypothetical protein
LKIRVKYLGEDHIATGEGKYTIGLLHLFCGETETAQSSIDAASKIYAKHLGEVKFFFTSQKTNSYTCTHFII